MFISLFQEEKRKRIDEEEVEVQINFRMILQLLLHPIYYYTKFKKGILHLCRRIEEVGTFNIMINHYQFKVSIGGYSDPQLFRNQILA